MTILSSQVALDLFMGAMEARVGGWTSDASRRLSGWRNFAASVLGHPGEHKGGLLLWHTGRTLPDFLTGNN